MKRISTLVMSLALLIGCGSAESGELTDSSAATPTPAVQQTEPSLPIEQSVRPASQLDQPGSGVDKTGISEVGGERQSSESASHRDDCCYAKCEWGGYWFGPFKIDDKKWGECTGAAARYRQRNGYYGNHAYWASC